MVRSAFVFAVAVALTGIVSAQSLTNAQILDAIKAGEAKKFDHLISDCIATAGFGENMSAGINGGIMRTGSFDVVLSTNAGRIAYMAARAKRLYKKLTPEDITQDLRRPAVVVTVEPKDPSQMSNGISVAAPIEHIVLKSKVIAEDVAQPRSVEKEVVEWSNLLGGKVQGNRAVAFFDYGSVKELPPGEFDIVVITTSGERRCKVGLKDRQKLFAAQ